MARSWPLSLTFIADHPYTHSMLLTGARMVLPDGIDPLGWLRVERENVVEVGSGEPPMIDDVIDLGGALVAPGFVDQHCHGGNRGDFFAADEQVARIGAAYHASRGTTTLIASLVTATAQALREQVLALLPLVADGTIAGVHLEGPWISPQQCGAHDTAALRAPDPLEIQELLDLADGAIRMVTLAPELPGGMEAIELLVANGVVAAIGHTEADFDTTRAAIDAGATVATHLFNAMPQVGKRAPGPVVALLNDPRVVVELIADGVHLHPAVIELVARAVGPHRLAAVTDAMGAAGAPDGDYVIGELEVTVADGVARLAASGALAGSTLTMDNAFEALVTGCGVDIVDASAMCSATPAHAMGFTDRGSISVGQRADLVVLDDRLEVTQVMRAGQWLPADPPVARSAS